MPYNIANHPLFECFPKPSEKEYILGIHVCESYYFVEQFLFEFMGPMFGGPLIPFEVRSVVRGGMDTYAALVLVGRCGGGNHFGCLF